MVNAEDAAQAIQDPTPVIEGRKTNVKLAAPGAKPKGPSGPMVSVAGALPLQQQMQMAQAQLSYPTTAMMTPQLTVTPSGQLQYVYQQHPSPAAMTQANSVSAAAQINQAQQVMAARQAYYEQYAAVAAMYGLNGVISQQQPSPTGTPCPITMHSELQLMPTTEISPGHTASKWCAAKLE